MGILGRLLDRGAQQNKPPLCEQLLPTGMESTWLPGDVEVQVAGESYHRDNLLSVQLTAGPNEPLTATFVPEPQNVHDQYAVAIYLNGKHVGHLHASVAREVQPALTEYIRKHGCTISCPAEIAEHGIGPHVRLYLDCGPLGLTPETVEVVPDLARELGQLLAQLDTPPPVLDGFDAEARANLDEAEKQRSTVEDDYDRDRNAWPRVERLFRTLVHRLTRNGDPLVSEAWLGVARSSRYQRGRRDETLAAYIEALRYDRRNIDAWLELIDVASAAPHVPTLVAVFEHIPLGSRERALQLLLAIADGRDRLGRMTPLQGTRLRTAILETIETQDDHKSTAFLAGQAGLRAEKDGEIDTAVAEWRRAIAAGNTDGKVADRYSIWLTKHRQYDEAMRVLNQAFAEPPQNPALRERMQKRLLRCERQLRKRPDVAST